MRIKLAEWCLGTTVVSLIVYHGVLLWRYWPMAHSLWEGLRR
jgi:hypothetical protein